MLEMSVRTVDHEPKSGHPVAILLPRQRAACAPLALPIQAADACSLSHELERVATPRGRAYALLAQTLAAIGGQVVAIQLEPGQDGSPVARIRVSHGDTWSEHQADVTLALGLAVYNSLPVLVSEQLARIPTGLTD